VPIGELGFTERQAQLDVGKNAQKGISMHAAQYTTTPISWRLRRSICGSGRPVQLGILIVRWIVAARLGLPQRAPHYRPRDLSLPP
jgi:hypothetical protein